MTGPLLHRYCPDHTPSRALCGLPLVGAEEVAERDVATDPRSACVVCDAIHGLPCEEACLSLQGDRAKGGTA